jgi:hypothetical protein
MRVIIPTLVGLVLLAATSHAAPNPAKVTGTELGAVPSIELVAEGCGPGWHRHHWRGRWGYWHGGHCVPNWR